MSHEKIKPKIITVFKQGYSSPVFFKDLTAGIIVGIVALPLAIAFAIASGVKPEQGLYTAIVAGFLISLLSGSRVQIGGPTGAFIVIIYGIVQKFGYDGLVIATIMAGVLLIIMGFAKLGAVIKYIPYPVTVGFTAGIALIIAMGQLRDLLGLHMEKVPAEFIEKIVAYSEHAGSITPIAAVIGIATIAIVFLWPRVTQRVPGSLVAILVTTGMVQLMDLPVETIGSRFGSVSGSLPSFRMPQFDWRTASSLVSPAITIALLAGIESLLSAVVADGMTGRKHRSNMELIAQGVANIASPLFGGIPATGAIARTATNIKNGGLTPIAGIIHAVVLLLIMLFFGKWAALIPMATLAGILVVVAYNMSEWHHFVKLLKSPKMDIAVLLVTFFLTILVDLTVAIQAGVVLAALLFMKRMSDVTQVGYITSMVGFEEEDEEDAKADPNNINKFSVPEGVEVFEVNGPFFFGAAERFKHTLNLIVKKPKVLILRTRTVLAMDATALHALEEVYDMTKREGSVLVLAGIHAQPMIAMDKAGFLDKVGVENVFESIGDALKRARAIVGAPQPEQQAPAVLEVDWEQAPGSKVRVERRRRP
ncbi:MAG: SulP family sulfate permease [Nitrospirae bacterium]|nr:SulP family sulfate permease [Nitrospirota bacterium]